MREEAIDRIMERNNAEGMGQYGSETEGTMRMFTETMEKMSGRSYAMV